MSKKSGHCLRCYCVDCDRDPAGEMHGHNCTQGPNCIETARNDTIINLRADLEKAKAALRDAERILEWNVGSSVFGEPEPKPVLERIRTTLVEIERDLR